MLFILKRPILSEKASKQMSNGIYHFVVDKSVNKIQIRSEVEKIYRVKVSSVGVINIGAKLKVFRKKKVNVGSICSLKKAIVRLKPGSFIDFV